MFELYYFQIYNLNKVKILTVMNLYTIFFHYIPYVLFNLNKIALLDILGFNSIIVLNLIV